MMIKTFKTSGRINWPETIKSCPVGEEVSANYFLAKLNPKQKQANNANRENISRHLSGMEGVRWGIEKMKELRRLRRGVYAVCYVDQ